MPDRVADRDEDVWESLLAIADAAGGSWPDRSRAACVALVKVSASREASLSVRLLADLRKVFGSADSLATKTILKKLRATGEAPWSDLHGKPLDTRGLAWRLRQYEVTSVKVRVGEKSLQGYRREHLWDVWTRYLTSPAEEGEHPEHPEAAWSDVPRDVPDGRDVPEHSHEAEHPTLPVTCDVPDVPDVPPNQCPACGAELTAEQMAVSILCSPCLVRAARWGCVMTERPCGSCGAGVVSCEMREWLSGRKCGEQCSHDPPVTSRRARGYTRGRSATGGRANHRETDMSMTLPSVRNFSVRVVKRFGIVRQR